MRVIVAIVGLVSGAVVGLAIGVLTAMGLGYWFQLTHPNDPSAGSIAIVVIATAPGGALVGAVSGLLAVRKRPRLFYATILPLTILLVALQLALSALRAMDRPRNFELEVRGTPGAEYVGLLSVDGDLVKHKGTLPARFEFRAFRIEMAFALVHLNKKNQILVNATADGNDLKTGHTSETGVYQALRSVGYSETFGGTSKNWSWMSEEEVDSLIQNETMPR